MVVITGGGLSVSAMAAEGPGPPPERQSPLFSTTAATVFHERNKRGRFSNAIRHAGTWCAPGDLHAAGNPLLGLGAKKQKKSKKLPAEPHSTTEKRPNEKKKHQAPKLYRTCRAFYESPTDRIRARHMGGGRPGWGASGRGSSKTSNSRATSMREQRTVSSTEGAEKDLAMLPLRFVRREAPRRWRGPYSAECTRASPAGDRGAVDTVEAAAATVARRKAKRGISAPGL